MAEERISLLLTLKDKMSKAVGKIKASFSKNMKNMQQSALVFAGAFAGVVAGVYKAVAAFREQERVEAELENRLKSTGYAAGLTASEIKKMAGELQKTTGVSDEVTMSAQNMLLTFTNIGKKSFPGATEAVIDMTAAMNKGKITQEGLKASAIMLGKGLNDPIGQLGALSRVGIAFTDQQKLQIKAMARAGDMAGAQAIILKELKKEFGGTASNLQTFEGAQRATAAAVGDMMEVLGEAFIPAMKEVLLSVKDAAVKFGEFLPKIKDLIIPITVFVAGLTGLLAIGGAIVTLGPMLAAAFAAITGPIGLAVIAITGLTSAFLYFKNSNSDFAVFVRAIFKTISLLIKSKVDEIKGEIKKLIDVFILLKDKTLESLTVIGNQFAKTYGWIGKIIGVTAEKIKSLTGELIKSGAEQIANNIKIKTSEKEKAKTFNEVFKEILAAEKAAIDKGIAAKEVEKENRAEIEAAAMEARLEGKAGEQEATLELDQEFIDRKAEMDAIAEEARQEFEAQKTEFEKLTGDQRTKLLIDKLGRERILKDTERMNELIKNGKHDAAMKLQAKLYQDAFTKMNKATIDKLDKGWKNHWAYLLLGEKMNKDERKKVDEALYTAFHNIMGLFNKDSMVAFNVMKGMAISETIISTYVAAQKAFTALAGLGPVGVVLGGIAAGAAVAGGLARVDQIRRQEPPKAETGGYVKKGGLAELHNAEIVLNKNDAANITGPQEINLVMDDEVMARWVAKSEETKERLQEEGTL